MPVNKNIGDLHPDLAAVYTEAKFAYVRDHPGGLRPRLGETHRSLAVQTAYYAQGRRPIGAINQLRTAAGLPLIGSAEAGRVITRSLPGRSAHGYLPARAFDVQLLRANGTLDWTHVAFAGWAAYVRDAAEKLGVAVSIGAYWTGFVDAPHTELKDFRNAKWAQ